MDQNLLNYHFLNTLNIFPDEKSRGNWGLRPDFMKIEAMKQPWWNICLFCTIYLFHVLVSLGDGFVLFERNTRTYIHITVRKMYGTVGNGISHNEWFGIIAHGSFDVSNTHLQKSCRNHRIILFRYLTNVFNIMNKIKSNGPLIILRIRLNVGSYEAFHPFFCATVTLSLFCSKLTYALPIAISSAHKHTLLL